MHASIENDSSKLLNSPELSSTVYNQSKTEVRRKLIDLSKSDHCVGYNIDTKPVQSFRLIFWLCMYVYV